MLPESSLSQLAKGLRSLITDNIDDLAPEDVLIGTPKQYKDESTGPILNLFFYRLAPSAYAPAGSPTEPLYVSVNCLVTAFTTKGSPPDTVKAGQNDLRLLGEVMRVVHQHPILQLPRNGDTAATIQIVPIDLPLAELNHIWSMMGSDVPYRPSIAYELALVPIPLERPPEHDPLVGSMTVDVEPASATSSPSPLRLAVIGPEGPTRSLSIPSGEVLLTLVVKGRSGERVRLHWRQLTNGEPGWVDLEPSPPFLLGGGTMEREVSRSVPDGQATVLAISDETGRTSAPVLLTFYS